MPTPPSRRLKVVAQDPTIQRDGVILTAELDVPNEAVEEGPRGYRVQVIDYDPGANCIYPALPPESYGTINDPRDPFAKASDRVILGNPSFHAQNVYAVVMRTLARFEAVLGRRLPWAFGAHQINVAPHGMAGANAFYSRRDNALVFGYFHNPESGKPVFSCLSHDIVVHETTHAILDGLRERFMDPSSPDQAAFHEGYADVIALLSGFAMKETVRAALESTTKSRLIPLKNLTVKKVTESILTGLAEEMGSALSGLRGNPLRRSVTLPPDPGLYTDQQFAEEHKRGELLVAAVMHAFLNVWEARMKSLGTQTEDGKVVTGGGLDATRVIEEASTIAGHLLKIMVRAIDYTPPVHLRFGDFLCAALTADHELVPDDSTYGFRDQLRKSFAAYGIPMSSRGGGSEPGLWERQPPEGVDYCLIRFDSLKTDVNEVFRFLWENRGALHLNLSAHTEVLSVRPCRRLGPDGFILHETVAEYLQILPLEAEDLVKFGIAPAEAEQADEDKGDSLPPEEDGDEEPLRLYGGGTLIFDEYGQLKFHITNRVDNIDLQSERVPYLWESGFFDRRARARRGIAALHLRKMAPWPLGLDHSAPVTKPKARKRKGQ